VRELGRKATGNTGALFITSFFTMWEQGPRATETFKVYFYHKIGVTKTKKP
jgi:hypothetical protein